MNPLCSSPKAVQRAWCKNEAVSAFGEGAKADTATDAFMLGVDYIHSMPIGCNIGDNFENKVTNHIKCNLQPSGFLAVPIVGWLFWSILSGLISWAVERIMSIYFPQKS